MTIEYIFSLLQLSDPALPVGSFSHSAGLETYVQKGLVRDYKTAEEFVRSQLEWNLLFNDAAFVSLAYDAGRDEVQNVLLELDRLCTATKIPRETREASRKMGARLIKIFGAIDPDHALVAYEKSIIQGTAMGHYSIAFGLAAHMLEIPKEAVLTGFYYNAAAGMVTNAVKLVPLGQKDGQQLLFSIRALVGALVKKTMEPDPLYIGLANTGFEIRCMQHEQLYSRLYMSDLNYKQMSRNLYLA